MQQIKFDSLPGLVQRPDHEADEEVLILYLKLLLYPSPYLYIKIRCHNIMRV